MARYINAKQLINRFMLKNKDKLRLSTIVNEIEIAEKGLSREVEAVEVVRCKNCKYGDVGTFSMSIHGQENIACYCELDEAVTDIDWYCPRGERKDK